MPLLRRREPPRERVGSQPRAMTASAHAINLAERGEAKRIRESRQPWQAEAMAYKKALGELRYATTYLGNSASRMRVMPAVFLPGSNEPIELTTANATQLGIPVDLAEASITALQRLGAGGPLAVASIMRRLTENFEITGECYLLGETDIETGVETWTIRSISEIEDQGSKILVKERPNGRVGDGARLLDPERTALVRLWWPDSEYSGLADSPLRAVLDVCEELLLLGRDVRATARSRVSNNGILFIPETMSVIPQVAGDESDPDLDPFMRELMATITTAIKNEGSAAAVAPMLIRGPEAGGAAIRYIQLNRPANAFNIQQREELITRIATGLDLPSEVLTGKVDLNHWTAWQVDDDTFRHHIEPIVVVEVDALTVGFLWPQLDELNGPLSRWDPAVIRRIVTWYDPTNLVTHPDRSKDAFEAWDRMALSDTALRRYLGFPDSDKPDSQELLLRMATKLRTLDPSVQVQILKRLDPTLKDAPAPGAAPPIAEGAGPGRPEEQDPPGPQPETTPDPSTAPGAAVRAHRQSDVWRRLAAARAAAVAPTNGHKEDVDITRLLDQIAPL